MMSHGPAGDNKRSRLSNADSHLSGNLERAKGIEPSYAAWEAAVLPLNYARECRQPTPIRRAVQIPDDGSSEPSRSASMRLNSRPLCPDPLLAGSGAFPD